jgi:lipopolysaccharide transport system permease protein
MGLMPSTVSTASLAPQPLRILEARPGWRLINFSEIWRYRELLYFLTWRDIKVRYKQTVLGAGWALLQPLATMLAFSLFFGRLAAKPEAAVPYPLFVLCGLLPWTFFANAISAASQSVVGNQGLVTKIYFPRLVIPMGAVAAGLVDFGVAIGLLLITMLYYGVTPTASVLWVPVLLICIIGVAFGAGTLLAALTVEYRDFRHIVPFMLQIWMFATPAIYLQQDAALGARVSMITLVNPLDPLISNFRLAMLGGRVDGSKLIVSAAWSVVILVVGCFYFRRIERKFADVI